MLKSERVFPFTKNSKFAKALYEEAFPAYERNRYFDIILSPVHPSYGFRVFKDGDKRVGLMYYTVHKGKAFLVFFAVDSSLRSKGYGSQALNWLKSAYKGVSIVMKTLHEDAKDIETRKRRFAFYNRNGFEQSGYVYIEKGIRYDIITNDSKFDADEFSVLCNKYSKYMGETSIERIENGTE